MPTIARWLPTRSSCCSQPASAFTTFPAFPPSSAPTDSATCSFSAQTRAAIRRSIRSRSSRSARVFATAVLTMVTQYVHRASNAWDSATAATFAFIRAHLSATRRSALRFVRRGTRWTSVSFPTGRAAAGFRTSLAQRGAPWARRYRATCALVLRSACWPPRSFWGSWSRTATSCCALRSKRAPG